MLDGLTLLFEQETIIDAIISKNIDCGFFIAVLISLNNNQLVTAMQLLLNVTAKGCI